MNKHIEIKQVTKQIDDFSLGPIDVVIERGTITALVGDNGSGKSTLIKMMMDLVNPDNGSIHMYGEEISNQKQTWKQHVAYLPQTPLGYDAFTGNDLRALVSRWYPHWDQKQFVTIVQSFGVPLHKKFGKLSQGEQQKLSIALTLPRNAEILILDEPTSFMDIPSKKQFMDLLVDYMENENRSIVFSSHQADDIQKLADYIILLRKGKQIKVVEKDHLLETYRKFWLKEPLTGPIIPGELMRDGNELISSDPLATEKHLNGEGKAILQTASIKMDEIITLLLTNG